MADDNSTELLDQYKKDIINDADIVQEQSQKANEDMRFINVSGGMWEGFLEDEFNDRTKLEFDIISNYINRFIGEWNQNRVGVEYKPDDAATSDEDAELLNGIYRSDFRQFSGKMAVDNGVDEVSTCGYGCFKLATLFEDDEDPENESQRIEWRPIHNAYNSIYWDNSAKRIDKRDATRCTELIQFTRESFEDKYPDKDPVSAFTPDTLAFNNYTTNRPTFVYIAKRYEVIRKTEDCFIYNNLQSNRVESYSKEDHELIKDELKADEMREFVRVRKVRRQSVEVTVFSGDDILEPAKRIAGKYIPIIPMYGYHSYIDGNEWYRGLVRKLMDAARLFNMQVSQMAENAASSGQEVPIFDPEQMEGDIKNLWADRNNKPYLLARALRDDDGNIVHHGPTSYLKPAQLDGSTQALMQIVPAFVQDLTGGAPQDTVNPDMSGKAIQALQKREDLNTQNISDNIRNSIEWSGTVYQSMASEIYTGQRMVRTIGKDGTESQTLLLKTVMDEKTGRLVQANDLAGKKFQAYADVGPQYETLRSQTVDDLKGMLDSMVNIPGGEQYLPAILATMMDNISGVGLGPLKEMNRRQMILQGLVKPETDEEKEMLADAQQPQQDPQAELIQAAAAQATSEARERDSKALDNTAAAEKKTAETQKILNDINVDNSNAENNRIKTLADVREQVFANVSALPLQ
jgi:hypothetical protein